MCGICGILTSAPSDSTPATHRMMRAMHHRGPDDFGLEAMPLGPHSDGSAAVFGFRRLSILDLTPAGHQPMVNPRTGDCLVFNGEIYNFRELRARLQASGAELSSTGDTEALLKALSMWGEHALEMLDGMFALAFYQASARRVLLARDPLGIKPLYVSRLGDRGVVFASEVRAILASGLVSDEYDPAGVASFLAYGAPQDPLTVHRQIKSFPCGTSQWLAIDGEGRLREEPAQRFWRFPMSRPEEPLADTAGTARDAINAAVRSHLVSDVPLAVLLSGGIDSGIVAAIASRNAARIATFCVGFESPSMPSELVVARATAALIGSRHHEVILRPADVLQLWEQWLRVADRPSIDGFNTFLVAKAVKDAGVTVACSGLGADEFFGGYSNFKRISRLRRMLSVWAKTPRAARKTLLDGISTTVPTRYRHRLTNLAVSKGDAVDLAFAMRQILTESQLQTLGLKPQDIGLRPDFVPQELYDICAAGPTDAFAAMQRVEAYGYMGNTLLRDSDANSMAHSVELRVPFLAKAVVEQASQTPGRIHLAGGHHKAVLREAFGDILPPAVLNRPKTGFTLPIGDWLYGELRDCCEAAVNSLADVPFLDFKAVRRLWSQFEQHRHSIPWSRPMLLVALGNYVASQRSRSAISDN